jgi:hypothetical protein
LGKKIVAKKRGGSHNNMLKKLSVANALDFQNYTRLQVDLFDSLLKNLMPVIQKQDGGIEKEFICYGIHLQ